MKALLIAIVGMCTASCVMQLQPVVPPDVDWTQIAATTTAIDPAGRDAMNGVYAVVQGAEEFGDTVVLRWQNDRLTLTAEGDVVFALAAGGSEGTWCRFEGYYREVRSDEAGRIQMHVDEHDGAEVIIKSSTAGPITIRGSYGEEGTEHPLQLSRVRPIKPLNGYLVIGHRAGGRNSERLGCSENSIEMAVFSEYLGANGIEIDIKRTRDNKLIIFHDETFSPRTVRGAYILGFVRDYTLHDIRLYTRLIFGETVPTMDEMLSHVIDSTTIRFIWLDVKDEDATDMIIEAQRRAIEYARSIGRDIEICFGIPTKAVLDKYKASPLRNTTPVLCELSPDDAMNLPTCTIWAPRWTNGIPDGDVARVHAAGRKVVTWTLDVADYMKQYVGDSRLDGILTNYPCQLAAHVYKRYP